MSQKTKDDKKQKNANLEAQPAPDSAKDDQQAAHGGEPQEEMVTVSRQKLEEVANQCAQYLAMVQRAQADFDNYRKRNAGVRAEAFDDGVREVLEKMLPVLDNLERAVEAIAPAGEEYAKGVDLILKQMTGVLFGLGVEEIAALGESFDPNWHHAVLQQERQDGVEANTVVEVLQKGYRWKDRSLRFAMVKVSM